MNIFLDDDLQMRQTPQGFKRFVTGQDLIDYVSQHDFRLDIGIISFDNDLGTDIEGYDVLKFLVRHDISARLWNLHTANVVARNNMNLYLASAMSAGVIDTARVVMFSSKEINDLINKGGLE